MEYQTYSSQGLPGPPTVLRIRQHSGFFSCCTVRLEEIVAYFNHFGKTPDIVDSSGQFGGYKPGRDSLLPLWVGDDAVDITPVYFDTDAGRVVAGRPAFTHETQFVDYRTVDYPHIMPFIQKYFQPSSGILRLVEEIQTKYSIDYANTCVLFYRGNDKVTETPLGSYADLIERGRRVDSAQPGTRFLIQSDERECLTTLAAAFPNHVICWDEIRHIPKNNAQTVDKVGCDNHKFSQLYLALTIIMSRCRSVVCGSTGNCSLWIMLYRGHAEGVSQFMRTGWVDP